MSEIITESVNITSLTVTSPLAKDQKEKKEIIRRPNAVHGRGIELKKRDEEWLKYLALGPGRFAEAAKFYLNEKTKKPLPHQKVYERLNQLAAEKYIVKKIYLSLKHSLLYFLGEMGVDALHDRGFEPEYMRSHIVPAKQIWHEVTLAGVMRKIHETADIIKTYEILSIQDDRMQKYHNSFQKGAVYPDLKVRVQPKSSPWVDLMIEVEGIELRRSLYMKKLRGLARKTENLIVIVRHTKRIKALYRYTEITIPKPEKIYFCVWHDFFKDGLSGKFFTYPDKKETYVRFT